MEKFTNPEFLEFLCADGIIGASADDLTPKPGDSAGNGGEENL